MTFWNLCTHEQTSPPDELGDAICADCGAVVRVQRTRAGLEDAFDSIYRDFGSDYGRHSKRCVRLDGGGWVCADDCGMLSRRRDV